MTQKNFLRTLQIVTFILLLSFATTTKAQDFTINPDPLVLVSIDYYFLASGYMTAGSLDNSIFIYDYGVFQYPLDGFPTTPLGLTYDEWFVYDTGGPLPGFPPYSALGDIVFVATNGTDTTTKDGAIVLTVLG